MIFMRKQMQDTNEFCIGREYCLHDMWKRKMIGFFYRMKDWIEERELSDEFIAWTMDKYGVFGTTFL